MELGEPVPSVLVRCWLSVVVGGGALWVPASEYSRVSGVVCAELEVTSAGSGWDGGGVTCVAAVGSRGQGWGWLWLRRRSRVELVNQA